MKHFLSSFILLGGLNAYGQIPAGVTPLEMNKSDLAPLDAMLMGAEVIGIGESGHGSKGYLETRLKLVKHLVETKNFRTIVLENGYSSTEKVNDFLKTCSLGATTPQQLLTSLTFLDKAIYQNEEVKNLISWLCGFNHNHPADPVAFYGIDIWERPWTDRNAIQALAALVKNEKINKFLDIAKNNCFAMSVDSWGEAAKLPEWDYLLRTWHLDPARFENCDGALMNIRDELDAKKTDFEAVAGVDKVFWASLAVRVQETYQVYRDLYRTDVKEALGRRDSTQAYLTLQMQERNPKNKKTILLAHNLHISKKQSVVVPRNPTRDAWVDVKSTGEWLRGHFGKGYKAIALTGYDITSSRDGHYPIPTSEDSLDALLARMGEFMLIDPRAPFIKSRGEWWMHLEFDEDGSLVVPSEQYDAIVFLKKSNAATPLKP
jgi:erythromycin esterase-like protein